MPTPRPKHIVTLHPLEPSVSINPGSRERVPNMQWAIHVWIWKSYHYFLSFRVWVSLKNVGVFPFSLPFLLNLLGLAHETSD
jgi:hypothetical protein